MHAYLVIAHNEPELLYKLLESLDYDDNDIYLHIDKNSDCFSEEQLLKACKKSNLYFAEREHVAWGGYSLINVELSLLEMAKKNGTYAYYHLVSGVDIPLKKQEDMHAFFKKNSGKEFIQFCDDDFNTKNKGRYARYHFLQDHIGRKKAGLYLVERVLLKVQSLIGVDRSKDGICYKGGAQWFSITDSLAEHLLRNKPLIEKMFKYSFCCDEFFLQTFVYNSDFYNNVYKVQDVPSYITCMRYIDWKRGDPYVFRAQDLDELVNSGYLFARKFSTAEESSKQCALELYKRVSGIITSDLE